MESKQQMLEKADCSPVILVLHDVEEARDSIESLLITTGYRVVAARNEAEAIDKARDQHPDLILVSLAGSSDCVIAAALRIRVLADLGMGLPIVIFCVATIPEGAEMAVANNINLVRPDNFDQLRVILRRLLPGRRPVS
jgi:CheY-like chemotaxis protein